jgi:hypothetical protein
MNNRLDEVAAALQSGITPALNELLPALLALTPALTGAVTSVADWVARLTGTKTEKEVHTSEQKEIMGARAARTAREAIRSGEATQETLVAIDKAEAELRADVEKQEQAVAKGRAPQKRSRFGDVTGTNRVEDIWNWATGETEARERRQALREKELSSSKEQLHDLSALGGHIADALQSGELKVRVVNQPPPPPLPPPNGSSTPAPANSPMGVRR